MKSSQTLWPISKRSSARLLMGSLLRGFGFLCEADQPSFGVAQRRDAVPPRHVGRTVLERHAARGEVEMRAVHVTDDEVEHGLARRPPLFGRTGIGWREADAGATAGLDPQILVRRIDVETREPERLGVEAPHLIEIVTVVAQVLAHQADV